MYFYVHTLKLLKLGFCLEPKNYLQFMKGFEVKEQTEGIPLLFIGLKAGKIDQSMLGKGRMRREEKSLCLEDEAKKEALRLPFVWST